MSTPCPWSCLDTDELRALVELDSLVLFRKLLFFFFSTFYMWGLVSPLHPLLLSSIVVQVTRVTDVSMLVGGFDPPPGSGYQPLGTRPRLPTDEGCFRPGVSSHPSHTHRLFGPRDRPGSPTAVRPTSLLQRSGSLFGTVQNYTVKLSFLPSLLYKNKQASSYTTPEHRVWCKSVKGSDENLSCTPRSDTGRVTPHTKGRGVDLRRPPHPRPPAHLSACFVVGPHVGPRAGDTRGPADGQGKQWSWTSLRRRGVVLPRA